MTWATYGSFAVFAVLIAVAPGPDTMVVLKNALAGGARAGIAAIGGITTACLLQATAVGLGVGAVLMRYQVVFEVIRWAGFAYLTYLGLQALRAAWRGDYGGLATGASQGRLFRRWREGFLSNITNPKVMAFYLSVLPQFLDPVSSTTGEALLLAYTVVAAGITFQLLLVLFVHKVRGWLSRRPVRRSMDALTGTALVGFGVALAVD